MNTIAQVVLASLATAPTARSGWKGRSPYLTALVLAILVICAMAQWQDPMLLPTLERSGAVFHGEAWRLLSAPWFQDGGALGGVLNLVMLAAVGTAAEIELNRKLWITAYLTAMLAGGLAGLAWQLQGAGSSAATLGLAGALFGTRARRAAPPRAQIPALAGLLVAAMLTAFHDLHGVAVLTGVLTAHLFRVLKNCSLMR